MIHACIVVGPVAQIDCYGPKQTYRVGHVGVDVHVTISSLYTNTKNQTGIRKPHA